VSQRFDPESYQRFLEDKMVSAPVSGLKVSRSDLSSCLKPHQADLALWMLLGGKRACFAAFGLGKTLIQLEVLRIIRERIGGVCMVICPLGVKQEFQRDGADLLGLTTEYVRSDAEVAASGADVVLTNYERVRDGGISVGGLTAVSLDEASVLRGYGTKTFQEFLQIFPDVPFRYVATATPSPNRFKELIHYSGFLGIMDTGEALTRFFQRDSQKANNLTLYPHKEQEFWAWLSSWAAFVTKPSDLRHDDAGYDLPPLEVHYHEIDSDHSKAGSDNFGQSRLFRDVAFSLAEAAREKRDTLSARVSKAIKIIGEAPDRHFIIWHHLEDERREIKRQLPAASEVYGSLDLEIREERIIAFSDGELQYLATKPRISGSGCNFQRHCSDAIFVGIDYKFNDFIQAIHRLWRFLQEQTVHIHVIHTESERPILRELLAKWERHKELVSNMSDLIRIHHLADAITSGLKRSIGVERLVATGSGWQAVHSDSILETAEMQNESIDLIVTSIPFGNHYEYSPSFNDLGHSTGNDQFFEQMDYLTPELLRVLRPGRVACVHVKDRILFGNVTGDGMPTVDPFHALTIFHYLKHGFRLAGMITIETDVVRENNQTYRLGWTENCKDSTKMGVGCPEYLLLFRKLPSDTTKGYADVPVSKSKDSYTRGRWQIDARAKWNSSGERHLTPTEIRDTSLQRVNEHFAAYMAGHVYDYDEHVSQADALDSVNHLPATFQALNVPARTAHVWHDIVRMRTLNAEQTRKRQQNHICPLQFDIIDRCIQRFSSPGELVYDPFAGIMSVPYRAILMGRKAIGVELAYDYWRDGVKYCEAAEIKAQTPTLFQMSVTEEEATG